MMSTAILMAASLEQMGARPIATEMLLDPGGSKETSFAKSFNERVEGADLLQGKSSVEEGAIALPGLKSPAFAKVLDEVAASPVVVKGKPVASLQMPEHGELKSVVTEEPVLSQVPAKVGLEEKAAAANLGTKAVDLPEPMEEVADDVSFDTPRLSAQPTVGVTGEVVEVSVTGEARPRVLNSGVGLSKGEIENMGLKKDSVSVKKTAKTQESAAAPKAVLKAADVVVNSSVAEIKPVAGSLVNGVIPAAMPIPAPAVVAGNEMGNTAEAISKAVAGAAKPLTEAAPGTADRVVRKETAIGEKVDATGTETMAPAQLIVLPKTEANPEKTTVAVAQEGKEDESKAQNTSVPMVAAVHAISAGVGTSSIVPTAVMSGNTPEGLITAKVPAGDAGAHGTGLSAGLKEQDGLGTPTPSMDGMPRMLTATPTMLEVGIQNGTHGWLKVRAEMADGGVVNASVSTASPAGQEMLHRELPALTAYLQDEKVAVNAVVIHAASVTGGDARSSAGMGAASGQTSQRNDGGGEQHPDIRKTALNGPDKGGMENSVHGVDENGSLPLAAYAIGGAWLSVRA
jgi:hypothetical protein